MKLYRLSTWVCGRRLYLAGLEQVQFVRFAASGRLYSRKQAIDLQKRFRKFNTRLKLEEHVAREPVQRRAA